MIEIIVENVHINEQTQQHVVTLLAKAKKAEEKGRFLFISINHEAAYAITIELKGTKLDPAALLPHDLLKDVIDALGGKIEGVEIWDLQEEVFRGRIVLDAADRRLRLNARLGDAIALALRAGAPIFVVEQVMKEAGVLLPGTPDESSSFDAQA